MSWVARSGGAFAGILMLSSLNAHAQAPDAPPAETVEPPAEADPSGCARTEEAAAPSEEFSKAVDRHARLAKFTRRLEQERERAAFEEAVARHRRLVEFTQRLQKEREEQQQREFEKKVSQYVKKHEFAKRLEQSRTRYYRRH